MKSVLKISSLAATIFFAVGCQADKAVDTKTTAETKMTVEAPISLQTEDEKAAYAIGNSFANYLTTSLQKPLELGIEIKKEIVLRGIVDVFNDQATMTEEETRTVLENLDTRVTEIMQKQSAEKSAKAQVEGDAFRADFAKQEGVLTTDSGLLYQVITPAEGAKPAATDTVKVHYKGTLTDGTQFDSSYDRGQPAEFPLDRVITGWTEGVQLMSVGSKFKFVIPPELAYGTQDSSSIPANSTLVFEVELLDINNQANAE